jgi:hypothetical protein
MPSFRQVFPKESEKSGIQATAKIGKKKGKGEPEEANQRAYISH